tara:strand:+ start:182 stop:1393 length:1212 start_codon:yes stop_codon:yes gene_type:complete
MLELNLAIIGLILSIIFSSAEIALISSNTLQIDVWIKQKYKLSNLAKNILDKKSKYLIVSLIGTNASNILCSSFATVYLINNNLISSKLVFIPITIIILLMGEILPKTIIREYSNIMLLTLSPFLRFFYVIFYPIVQILNSFNLADKKVYFNNLNEQKDKKRLEFQHLYEQVDDKKSIEKEEQKIISNIFEYSKSTVSDVMTPRTDISAISEDLHLDKVAHAFIDSGHSKLPVYTDNIDNIIGIIYLYDLYTKPASTNEIIKDAMYVPFSKTITDLMTEFREEKHSIAIVLDEHGGTAGLITIEDVFEELFGEFEDEFDYEESDSKVLNDKSILVNTKMEYQAFNEKFGAIIPEGDYETVGGYITKKLGRIPNKNEHLFLPIGHVIIRKSSSRNIEQIQIYLN